LKKRQAENDAANDNVSFNEQLNSFEQQIRRNGDLQNGESLRDPDESGNTMVGGFADSASLSSDVNDSQGFLSKCTEWCEGNPWKTRIILSVILTGFSVIGGYLGTPAWDKDKSFAQNTQSMSGCYATNKKTGEVRRLGGDGNGGSCGYSSKMTRFGAKCTLPCNCSDGDCVNKCPQKGDCVSYSCEYKKTDPGEYADKVKNGAYYICSMGNDLEANIARPCPAALFACGLTEELGTCTTTHLANAGITEAEASDWTIMPICVNPVDVFLTAYVVKQNLDLERAQKKHHKVFFVIMTFLSVLMVALSLFCLV